jgi:sortase A
LTTLDNGPGHWPGTAMPGEIGNVVVAAHRTSHGGPFRNIDQLVAGDTVMFTTEAGEIPYRVTGTQVVNPDAIWIVDPTSTPTATLFACHPPGSVAQRIVVNLELAA